jgi:HEAT repeat protein
MIRRRQLDPTERGRRVRALPRDPSSCDALLTSVEDESLDVARAALDRLGPLADRETLDKLRDLLLVVDIGLVGDVADVLRQRRDPKATEVAVHGLTSASGFGRHKAAVALRSLRDPRARGPLQRVLRDREAAVRRTAVEALGQLPEDAATNAALEQMLRDDDAQVRAAAVAAIATCSSAAAIMLRAAVVDRHASVRRAAAARTGRLDGESVRVLIGDPDADVRASVLWALELSPRAELIGVVAASLGDPDWHVRRAGCHAMGGSGQRAAKEPLVHALVDPHPMVRAAALSALEGLLANELVDELERQLEAADNRLRRALVEALAGRGPRAERALLGLTGDPERDVRLAVAHALSRSDSEAARAAMEAFADDDDLAVRHAAWTLLERAHGEA